MSTINTEKNKIHPRLGSLTPGKAARLSKHPSPGRSGCSGKTTLPVNSFPQRRHMDTAVEQLLLEHLHELVKMGTLDA